MDFPFAFAPAWKIIKISVAFVAELKKKSCFLYLVIKVYNDENVVRVSTQNI